MIDYLGLARRARPRNDPGAVVLHLDDALPNLWLDDYLASASGEHMPLFVTPSGEPGKGPFISYLFDLISLASEKAGKKTEAHDRVIACWGVTRREPGSTRDRNRIGGFLKGVWSAQYKGRDRGHLFAHTAGGGMDINLIPQLSKINRDPAGAWRRFETLAATNPGSFVFVRPVYKDETWVPSALDYGLFLFSGKEVSFQGGQVPN